MILLVEKGPDLELHAEVFTEEMTSRLSLEGEGEVGSLLQARLAVC